MNATSDKRLVQLDAQGCLLLRAVYDAVEVTQMIGQLAEAFERGEDDGPLRSRGGGLYGARNVARLWPPVLEIWRKPALSDPLSAALGERFGLVRVLFFDKPPDQSWSLPWHRDLTIAVADHSVPTTTFRRPTIKQGVPHVEAPRWLLERMLTARIHLDEMTAENGPLEVLPGSHRMTSEQNSTVEQDLAIDAAPSSAPRSILSDAGDVFLMRPLLVHCSGHSQRNTTRHRRILHLEFAADPTLPDGYAWQMFVPHAQS